MSTNRYSQPVSVRYLLFSLSVAFLCVIGLASCGGKSQADNPGGGAPPAMPVQVIVAQPRAITDATEYLALLKSRHSAIINPQVEGQVVKILVKSGDHVKPGDPLLQIDPMKQEAALSSQEASRVAQEATVRLAQISLERAKKLFDAGVISKQDLDNAQTYYDSSVAQLNSLEHQVQQQKVELHYYNVSAPTEGIVGDIPVRVGDRVAVTTLLTTVDEPGALEAYIYVPAARAHDLHLGLPVKLISDVGAVLAESQITFVSPQVDPETQTVLAKAIIVPGKANFRIAQQVRTQISWGSRTGQVVPVLAVQRINGEFFAFVATKETHGTVAKQRLLRLGETVGNDYAVLEGIAAGDHVIVSGLQFLQEGAPVAEQITNDKTSPGHENSPTSR